MPSVTITRRRGTIYSDTKRRHDHHTRRHITKTKTKSFFQGIFAHYQREICLGAARHAHRRDHAHKQAIRPARQCPPASHGARIAYQRVCASSVRSRLSRAFPRRLVAADCSSLPHYPSVALASIAPPLRGRLALSPRRTIMASSSPSPVERVKTQQQVIPLPASSALRAVATSPEVARCPPLCGGRCAAACPLLACLLARVALLDGGGSACLARLVFKKRMRRACGR